MPKHLENGQKAEEIACDWLTQNGFAIVARNVRYKAGEIDIIAQQNAVLCFVEVRSRKNNQFDRPENSIGSLKQSKLIKAAMLYLKRNYSSPPCCRFDVIAVTGYDESASVKYIPHAFEVPIYPRNSRGNPWQAY